MYKEWQDEGRGEQGVTSQERCEEERENGTLIYIFLQHIY